MKEIIEKKSWRDQLHPSYRYYVGNDYTIKGVHIISESTVFAITHIKHKSSDGLLFKNRKDAIMESIRMAYKKCKARESVREFHRNLAGNILELIRK